MIHTSYILILDSYIPKSLTVINSAWKLSPSVTITHNLNWDGMENANKKRKQ